MFEQEKLSIFSKNIGKKRISDCDKSLDFLLGSKIHNSILFVRYENIAPAPNDQTRKIYNNFNIEINDELFKKFEDATHAHSKKEKSTFTVNKGKTEEELFNGWKASVPELVSENEIHKIENGRLWRSSKLIYFNKT